MLDAYIFDGLRSPFGRHAGAIAAVRPDDLAAEVMRALIARLPWKAEDVEDMSRAPFAVAKAEAPYARELRVYDTTLGARFPNPGIVKAYGADSMPETGDNVAKDHGISRS